MSGFNKVQVPAYSIVAKSCDCCKRSFGKCYYAMLLVDATISTPVFEKDGSKFERVASGVLCLRCAGKKSAIKSYKNGYNLAEFSNIMADTCCAP